MKNSISIILASTALLNFNAGTLSAQDQIGNYKPQGVKNNFSVTTGADRANIDMNINLCYDRRVYQTQAPATVQSVWIRIGFGQFYSFSYIGDNIPILAVYDWAWRPSHHIELGFGATAKLVRKQWLWDGGTRGDPLGRRYMDRILLPNSYIGYRYQNPRIPILGRITIGYPEMLSLGLGYGF